jgi:hypothetical protein
MTNDEILQAAKKAGATSPITATYQLQDEQIIRFAAIIEKIIEKRTIERCAVVAEKEGQEFFDGYQYIIPSCYDISAAIRKLGEQE